MAKKRMKPIPAKVEPQIPRPVGFSTRNNSQDLIIPGYDITRIGSTTWVASSGSFVISTVVAVLRLDGRWGWGVMVVDGEGKVKAITGKSWDVPDMKINAALRKLGKHFCDSLAAAKKRKPKDVDEDRLGFGLRE